ncbi:pimeloyl-ACP methyl ester carboxylesterase [Microterricola gilva]|uniref:Pimeloyl-ACP methyl ester carboxylesterase n=1 Tax=Microterricola gilva TaxID=393267 RepID=A0A4Q8APG9_9MICO|nr:alpha/beta hydrolase [Microterricola gilva]RZU65859.1 pimeloyl-ACP methyl ester carboxylesterase [Microterricola gilva]
MDIVLVPGFWLDASSWTEILPPLVEAGHRVHPLTPPGLESPDAPRAGIGLRQQIDAVTAVVDAIDGPVVLVGHSGGGAVIYGVTDARPDRIARAIYVDSGPLGPGESINDNLPYEGDDIPLPPWDFFDDADLIDLDDDLRAAFRARAIPEPRGVAYDAMELHDERRLDVPTTVIACEFTAAQLSDWVGAGQPFVAELARLTDAEYVDLPTGHWPQFTKPDELGALLLATVER